MTATADMILERRRQRRRLAFWRILAIVAVVAAVIAWLPKGGGIGSHIARVSIDGVIRDDPERQRAILDLAGNDSARAVIVRVNSPGGSVVPSQSIYQALLEVGAKKPVVTVMDEVAASGGYIASLAGERIFASGNTLTGSIGVIIEEPNVAGLMSKLGIEVTRVKSGPLKGEPSLTAPPSPEALAAQQALIDDTFAWFSGLVAERRNLSGAGLARVTDGRAFTGRQALELGLVDALGDEETARDWLAEAHGLDRDMPVVDHEWSDDALPWPLGGLRRSAAALGRLGSLADAGPRLYAILH